MRVLLTDLRLYFYRATFEDCKIKCNCKQTYHTVGYQLGYTYCHDAALNQLYLTQQY